MARVVVLSNNDGCVIARTNEAKDLGLKMGSPYHLVQKQPELKSVVWKSSNYVLYGDMSRRMYDVLAARVPRVSNGRRVPMARLRLGCRLHGCRALAAHGR